MVGNSVLPSVAYLRMIGGQIMKKMITQWFAFVLAISTLTWLPPALSSAAGSVAVKATAGPTITSSIIKSVTLGATLTFSLNDFSSCYSINNGMFKNIVIMPSNDGFGVWYKGTDAFGRAKMFDAADIGSLKFKGTLCGQAAFTWTVSNEKGISASGYGYITVTAAATLVSYKTDLNAEKAFCVDDFNAASKDATGAYLLYVSFSEPPVLCGTLYDTHAPPSSPGTQIAADPVCCNIESQKISGVTFVPAANYSGSFTFSYTGVNIYGISYVGNIKMIVGTAGDVAYATPERTPRMLNASDFSTACTNMTKAGLSYVYFTEPPASSGTLYNGYVSPLNPGTSITSNSLITLQKLSCIAFVPAEGYNGVLSIPFTGVSISGAAYTGYIKITVGIP